MGVAVGVGTGVTVAVTVGDLVAVVVIVDKRVGVWIGDVLVALPCNVRPQAERKEIITRQAMQ
jgi:hypothetical protein